MVVPITGGKARRVLLLPPRNYVPAVVSPDGKTVAVIVAEPEQLFFWITDLASGRQIRSLPYDQRLGEYSETRFSPDGRVLVHVALQDGGQTLLSLPIDGSPPQTLLDTVSESIPAFAWSPSSRQLAVVHVKSSSDVVLITDQQGKGKD